jgi:thioredoxin-related protein
MRRRQWLGSAAAIAISATVRAQPHAEERLQRIDDLRALAAEITRLGVPLLVLFSTPGCPYCLEVRRNYLAPRAADPAATVLIREVEITSTRTLTDLDGGRISERSFAERHGVRAVPVVTLFDDRLRPLGTSLVGLDRSGFYESYLQAAIDTARQRLRGTR